MTYGDASGASFRSPFAALASVPRSAVPGGLAWPLGLVALAVCGNLGWAEAMLLLAALVIMPLGLGLIRHRDACWRWAVILQCPAAVLLVVALCLPQGTVAAAFTVPYLAVTTLAAMAGVIAAWRRGLGPLSDLCGDVALVFLPVAAGWAWISRAGIPVLGFDRQIVQLTAVHAHYVGFALPLLAGMILRRLPGRLATVVGWGSMLGFPTVAAGMTLSQVSSIRWVELASVWLLVGICWLLAVLQIRVAMMAREPAVLKLQGLSALSLAAAMVLAAVYGTGQFRGIAWLDIPAMLPTHGALNALGFAVCGMLSWHLSGEREPS